MSKQEQASKEWTNIDYSQTNAYRSIKALNNEGIFSENKLPDSEWSQLQRLRKIDSLLRPEKGIKKVITTLTRQVVTQHDKDGRQISKEYLTIGGYFLGKSFSDEDYSVYFDEGWYKKPRIVKTYKYGKKFNSETGEDLGEYVPSGFTIEYTIELPKTKRKEFIEKIIQGSPGTFPENIHYYYKDTSTGQRDSTFSYEQWVGSDIEELRNLSKRGAGAKGGPGFYRDRDNKLRDKDGNLV